MKLRMSSSSATLSVILKSCSASDCQLKRGYVERSACDPHKSSTVNPKGRFQLTMKFLLAAACCLSGGSPHPVGPQRVRERHSALPVLNDKLRLIVGSFVVLKKRISTIPQTFKVLKKDGMRHTRRQRAIFSCST